MTKRKIEIKRINNAEAQQVCFSKHRPSVFKKASELYTLCGAEVAMLVKSSGGNLFSFGAPSSCKTNCRIKMKKMKSLQEAFKQEADGNVMAWLDAKVEEICKEDPEEFNRILVSLKDMIRGRTNQLFNNYAMYSNIMRLQHCVTTLPNQQVLNSEDVKPVIHHVPISSIGWNLGMDVNPNSSVAHVDEIKRHFP
uniref:MADS-box domain-containing protein n=1 Tax=Leersia perrieri TaxID=77586 RepID=A0A0D9XTV3_9ORYZ